MSPRHDTSRWLPTSVKEVRALGWDYLDVIIFTGDAYVDHPAFGPAVVGRLLQDEGYRVAIVPQPNWKDDLRDFKKLGVPRLFFGVSAGNMDSMVNHYTAAKRLRSDDAYTAGSKAGFRPDRAVTVYSRILKGLYPNVPVVIGGIEASLRRFTHYDYWEDKLMPSVLIDSGADLLAYGMADKVMPEIAKTLKNGFNAKKLRSLRQVSFLADEKYVSDPRHVIRLLNSFEECLTDKTAFGDNFKIIETESNRLRTDTPLAERVGDRYVVVNPPHPPLSPEESDRCFDLPYTRLPHPRYEGKGDFPAYEMIKNSVNIHHGCFGGCSFCTISAHQGKFINSRTERSILSELEKLASMPGFKGNLSDLGGPSANMYGMRGRKVELCEKCSRPSCIYPSVCRNLENDHGPLIDLYDKASAVKGIKKIFIGSGIRYDMFDEVNGDRYLRKVVRNHTSGRLKVAPEHTEDHVVSRMRKPGFSSFVKLHNNFNRICSADNLPYSLVPYFVSSHPGCTEKDMASLNGKVSALGYRLRQVQDLTPTPMTLSSVMYYTGTDPYTGERLYVARDPEQKKRQKEWFFGPGRSDTGTTHKPGVKKQLSRSSGKTGQRPARSGSRTRPGGPDKKFLK